MDNLTGFTLKKEDLQKNVARLFEKSKTDESFARNLIENPSGTLSEFVSMKKMPPDQESMTNRFLFSILANDQVREWLQSYKYSGDKKNPSTHELELSFRRDFAAMLINLGDIDIFKSMLEHTAKGYDIPWVAEQFVTGPNQSVVTSPATPSTSDQSLRSSQNFNGLGFGDGTIDPAIIRVVIGQLIQQAKQLKWDGTLSNIGSVVR